MQKNIKAIKEKYLNFVIALLRYHVMIYKGVSGKVIEEDTFENIPKLKQELIYELRKSFYSLEFIMDPLDYLKSNIIIHAHNPNIKIPKELYFINNLITFKTKDFLDVENTKKEFKTAIESHIYREVKEANISKLLGNEKTNYLINVLQNDSLNYIIFNKQNYHKFLALAILLKDDILESNFQMIYNVERNEFLISNPDQINKEISDISFDITQKKLIQLAKYCYDSNYEKININDTLKNLNYNDRRFVLNILEELYLIY
jgi:hypothetical protein